MKKTTTINCEVYEDKNRANPQVSIEAENESSALFAIVGILRAYIVKDIADAWVLHKLVDYADQPDEETRTEYMKQFEKEYRERVLNLLKKKWEEKENE